QTPGDLAEALATLLRTGELPGEHQALTLNTARTLIGHTGVINGVAFLPDGKALVTGSADRSLRVWDVQAGGVLRTIGDGKQEVNCLAVVPTNGRILAGQGVTIRVYDSASGKEAGRLSGHNDAVRAVAVSPDGELAVSGGDDRTIRLWDLTTFREIQ